MSTLKKQPRKNMSVVMMAHYFSLTWRGILFLILLYLWIANMISGEKVIVYQYEKHTGMLLILWLLFAVEMVFRLFPSAIRSPGCQKQFARNYRKTGRTDIIIADNHATVIVALIWIVFNAAFGALHMIGVLNRDFMLLLCSAYSVCDMICILFFCPFQTFFFRNRCCVTCRIYNWDFAMIFTPLFFVPGPYTWSLLALAVVLLIRWEVTFYLHPERFSENTNSYLSCASCTEKLCRHKRQLITLRKKIDQFARKRIQMLKKE